MLAYLFLAGLAYVALRLYLTPRKILINWVANSHLYYYFHLRQVRQRHATPGYKGTSHEAAAFDGHAAIVTAPFLDDNYAYLLIDKASGDCALVDPADPYALLDVWREVVLRYRNEHNITLRLKYILTTHKHFDHAGGNKILAAEFPDVVVVGGILDNVLGATKLTWHKDALMLGSLHIETLALPCHTIGHVGYYVTAPGKSKDGCVFTGDTLFVAGTGRFFEGNGDQMYRNLHVVLGGLPKTTNVYGGHEYTLENLAFALFVEPENEAVQAKIEWAIAQRKKRLPTVPSTLADEWATNPFLRTDVPAVAQAIATHHHAKHPKHPGELVQCLRELKDADVHVKEMAAIDARF
ncbi:hypothetical protein SDRG_16113 [Saprolegnia diclina VS20]|uniref:Metallo-beta-lactamase domain-containing protein n=1 Tax=Saprolegnia diclina (strain VS20) TaxID=1156394 RepID=T0R978_SAPDV|nr:hypothetical protein SDRG_16113 [Saprolegnia diclina VS20]EQC26047.1 hypothetical protein SDRG_16113 [Saprolegnia diclina VS20]|eukprot:XP_008620532.1 hypothetical protein SDRG_16113 [Saprolegnia diclina VS20]